MVTVSVCIGSACHLKGSYNVIQTLQQLLEEYQASEKVELKAVFCMGNCVGAVSVQIDDELFSLSSADTRTFFEEKILSRLS